MTDSKSSGESPEAPKNRIKAAREKRNPQGERRVVTILFCDVAGSTRMAEQLDPEDWAEIMDDAFDLLIEPIFRDEGTVARSMGDAVNLAARMEQSAEPGSVQIAEETNRCSCPVFII